MSRKIAGDVPNPVQQTEQTIEQALQVNQRLQMQVRAKLKRIAELKQQNRQKCLALQKALKEEIEKQDEDVSASNGNVKRKRGRPRKEKTKVDLKPIKRRFFIAQHSSIPDPNPDELKRRRMEGDLASGIYVHRFSPWTKVECDLLVKIAEEVRQEQLKEKQQEDPQASVVKDVDIDFDEVTKRIREELKTKTFRAQHHSYSNTEGSATEKYIKRPVVDYRIKFLNSLSPSINKTAFTKEESLKIIEFLHKFKGNPPWHIVAQTLDSSRTPFQCFRHAQTKLSNTLGDTLFDKTFSLEEDELLFKFCAAHGSQAVIDKNLSFPFSQKFIPDANHKQVAVRANHSILNPNYLNGKWSEEEERLIAMSMKVFSESDEYVSAKASCMVPQRAAKMVSEKWSRGMNPCYNTQPYSKSEDKALVQAIKKRKGIIDDWSDVAKRFPTRNPISLMKRFLQIGDEEDIAKLHGHQVMQRNLRSIGRGVKLGQSSEEGEGLSSSDFAVRFKTGGKNRDSDDKE